MRGVLLRYQVMSMIVGVLLVVLCLIGLPLHYGHLLHPALFPVGGPAEQAGSWISAYLGVAHGWLYMIFLFTAFHLSRRAGFETGFTLVTLVAGTVPLLSFWAERRATRRVREEHADELVGFPDRS